MKLVDISNERILSDVRREFSYTIGVSLFLLSIIVSSILMEQPLTTERILGSLVVLVVLQSFVAFSFCFRLKEIRRRLLVSDTVERNRGTGTVKNKRDEQ